ncbi:hypothetical protein D3C85_1052020 [compost metagenome]
MRVSFPAPWHKRKRRSFERRFRLYVVCWISLERDQNRYFCLGASFSSCALVGASEVQGQEIIRKTSRWSKSNTPSSVWAEVWAGGPANLPARGSDTGLSNQGLSRGLHHGCTGSSQVMRCSFPIQTTRQHQGVIMSATC